MVSKSKRRRLAAARALSRQQQQPQQQRAQQPKRRRGRRTLRQRPRNGFRKSQSSGTDVLTDFTVKSTFQPGTVLYQGAVSPTLMKQTRFHSEAKLWGRWKPLSMSFALVGAAPMTSGGSIVMAWVPDPSYKISAGVQALRLAMAAERKVTCRLDKTYHMPIPTEANVKWYHTDPTDQDLSCHGTLFVILVSPPTGVSGTLSFTVTLDWRTEWEGSQYDETPDVQTWLQQDSGYTSLFTTSDSAWDSGYLTFKNVSGGSMVPFSGAVPGVVYKAATGVVVPYKYKKGDAVLETTCIWFSLVRDYAVKGLVLHTSEDSARRYQKTGLRTECIPYYNAGSYVTPAILKLWPYEVALINEHRLSVASTSMAVPTMIKRLIEDREDVTERMSRLESMISNLRDLVISLPAIGAPSEQFSDLGFPEDPGTVQE
nr:putative capsid protein [Uzakla mosquito-associated permutotetra-like virus]